MAVDGPNNEHLIRDVGGLYVGLLALIVGAIVRPTPPVTRTDQVLNVIGLGASVLLGLILCLPRRKAPTI